MVWQSALEAVPLYLADTYLTEVVTRVAVVGDGGIAVRDNLFHPQGGGQPADRGWIGECEVRPVRDEDGLVYLDGELGDLREGDIVRARIDAELRLLHAALHTAGHLVEGVAMREGWKPYSSNHFPGQARIELTPDGDLRADVADRIQAAVRAALADDLPVSAIEGADGHRVVRVSDVHEAPCGGTHVRSLADLADVTISGVKLKKGRVRVSYSATHRPVR